MPRENPILFSPIRNPLVIVLLAIFTILFYYIKFQSPALITSWFQAQNYAWLNKLSGVSQPQNLNFYLGQIEERIFGPLSQLISGLLFALLVVFWRQISPGKFGLAVFVYLILTKFDVLFFPPYGDAIGGPFAELLWL